MNNILAVMKLNNILSRISMGQYGAIILYRKLSTVQMLLYLAVWIKKIRNVGEKLLNIVAGQ